MNRLNIFYVITCASSLFCSEICAGGSPNVGSGSRSSSIQESLENSLDRRTETKSFAPNSLFYPPSHSTNPMTSLQNDTFLQSSFHWSYFRHPNGQLWARNSYGDHVLLDP